MDVAELSIDHNDSYYLRPSEGYSYIKGANINVNVPQLSPLTGSATYSRTGTYSIIPPSGSYYSEFTATVDVPPPTSQTLAPTIRQNGTYDYIPTKDYYSDARITVDVPTGLPFLLHSVRCRGSNPSFFSNFHIASPPPQYNIPANGHMAIAYYILDAQNSIGLFFGCFLGPREITVPEGSHYAALDWDPSSSTSLSTSLEIIGTAMTLMYLADSSTSDSAFSYVYLPYYNFKIQ